jgi:DoxX-like family
VAVRAATDSEVLLFSLELGETMKTTRSWKTVGGWVLHGLVAGVMILAGSAQVFGLFPQEEVAKLGLSLPIQVIGAGELAAAILLLVPRTSSVGLLLASGFWGGAICLHMSKSEPFVMQSAFLLVAWVGGYLRIPGAFGSFAVQTEPKQVHDDALEALNV